MHSILKEGKVKRRAMYEYLWRFHDVPDEQKLWEKQRRRQQKLRGSDIEAVCLGSLGFGNEVELVGFVCMFWWGTFCGYCMYECTYV